MHRLVWLEYANNERMGCGSVVIDRNRCANNLRIVLFSLPSNRLHRTDDGGLTDHRNASATRLLRVCDGE